MKSPRRRVGDGVDDADIPIGDPAADDLERGHSIRDGAQHVGDGRRFDVDVAIEQERHLRLDLRLQHATGGDGLVLGDHHVGEQDREVGPIDAELLLHGAGGQPDLASDQATSLRLPVGRVLLLYSVGRVDVELGQLRSDGRDRGAGVGRADPGGEFAVFGLLVHLKILFAGPEEFDVEAVELLRILELGPVATAVHDDEFRARDHVRDLLAFFRRRGRGRAVTSETTIVGALIERYCSAVIMLDLRISISCRHMIRFMVSVNPGWA